MGRVTVFEANIQVRCFALSQFCNGAWAQETRMMGYTRAGKTKMMGLTGRQQREEFGYIFSRFDTMHECNRQTETHVQLCTPL